MIRWLSDWWFKFTLPRRVQRGIRVLDKSLPVRTISNKGQVIHDSTVPWYMRIEVSRLDLTSNTMCVVGQVYGNWHRAPWLVTRKGIPRGFLNEYSRSHAVDIHRTHLLQGAWVDRILVRQHAYHEATEALHRARQRREDEVIARYEDELSKDQSI